jgi:hypothetical protein
VVRLGCIPLVACGWRFQSSCSRFLYVSGAYCSVGRVSSLLALRGRFGCCVKSQEWSGCCVDHCWVAYFAWADDIVLRYDCWSVPVIG